MRYCTVMYQEIITTVEDSANSFYRFTATNVVFNRVSGDKIIIAHGKNVVLARHYKHFVVIFTAIFSPCTAVVIHVRVSRDVK